MKLIRLAATIIFILHFVIPSTTQGLIFNDNHYIDFPGISNLDGSKTQKSSKLDTIYKVSLKEYAPVPRHQKEDANCVGWAVGYAAQSISHNYKHNVKDQQVINHTAFSPHFIYNQIKLKDCKLGAEIIDAFGLLHTSGNVFYQDFVEEGSDCNILPDQDLFRIAHNNRIQDFVKLFDPEAHRLEKINNVKLALSEGFPVVIALQVVESFFKLENGEDTWYSELGSQVPIGGHALTVIGFDETIKAFEVINSWGTAWANNGFAWISYDDFDTYAKYGFCFSENDKDIFSVQINFKRKVLITSDGTVQFADELFKYIDSIYTPVNSYAKTGSIYQFQFFNSRKDYKIYCLNRSNTQAYFVLLKVDGENHNEYGFTLPGDDTGIELTDHVSEEFIFVITREELPESWESAINQCYTRQELEDSLKNFVTINRNTRHSYNKVGFISELGVKEAVLLQVAFNIQTK